MSVYIPLHYDPLIVIYLDDRLFLPECQQKMFITTKIIWQYTCGHTVRESLIKKEYGAQKSHVLALHIHGHFVINETA